MAKIRAIYEFCERWLSRVHLLAWLWDIKGELLTAAMAMSGIAYFLWDQIKQTNPLLVVLVVIASFALLTTALNQLHKLLTRLQGLSKELSNPNAHRLARVIPLPEGAREKQTADLTPDLNAAKGFLTITVKSKWAQDWYTKPEELPEGMYEASMKSDQERFNERLKTRLSKEIHDLLALGKLKAWGRSDSSRPMKPIEASEWVEIELRFDNRSLTSTPQNICAVHRTRKISGVGRLVYFDVHFSTTQLYTHFPLIEDGELPRVRLRVELKDFWCLAEAHGWKSDDAVRRNFLEEIRQRAFNEDLVLWGRKPKIMEGTDVVESSLSRIDASYWRDHKIDFVTFLHGTFNKEVHSRHEIDADEHRHFAERYFDLHVETETGRLWLRQKERAQA
jgi:hypothetical protein